MLVSGSGSFSVAGNASVVTDPVAYALDQTKNLIVAVHFNAASDLAYNGASSLTDIFYKGAANEAAATAPAGYSTVGSNLDMVGKIEVLP